MDLQRILNDQDAEEAVRLLLSARKEKDRLLSLVDAERARLDMQETQITEKYDGEIAYYSELLSEYFKTVDTRETKTQRSYQLLSGRLIYKKLKTVPERDEKILLPWAKENAPEFVQVSESVRWGDIKPLLTVDGDRVVYTATGEVVEGLGVVETGGEFEVK